MWSPWAVREARARMSVEQRNREEEALKKAEMKELVAANKLYHKKIAEERREQRVREKVERDRVKAEKAQEVAERRAQKESQKQALNAQKALQLSQRGKRKASPAHTAKITKKRGAVGGVGSAVARERSLSPPPITTRRGRNVTLPSKFK